MEAWMVAPLRFRRLTPVALLAALVVVAIAWAAAPEASASACGKWGDAEPGSISNGETRKAVVCLINKQRDQAGLKNLENDKRLQRAAQRHTDRMDGTGCFDHTCGGEGALDNRLEDVGYLIGGLSRWAYGENIAWGMRDQGTPEAIVKAWMNSAGHRANILDCSLTKLGVGVAEGAGGPWWTQLFG
jgi:uncharacterized protein YkwD